MQVVVIIPARFASTRFPGKVIAPVAGKPMIQRVWEQARKARRVSEVIVATDDRRVGDLVMGFGGHVILTSPEHQSGTERVAEAADKVSADVVINVQGDEPLIAPESIDLAAGPLLDDEGPAMASLMHPLQNYADYQDPNVVKVVVDDQDFAVYFSRSPIPYYRDQQDRLRKWQKEGGRPEGLAPAPMKHIGLYAYRTEFLLALARLPRAHLERAEALEQLRVLAWGFKIKMVETPHDSVSVDVPADVAKVEALIRESGNRCEIKG